MVYTQKDGATLLVGASDLLFLIWSEFVLKAKKVAITHSYILFHFQPLKLQTVAGKEGNLPTIRLVQR